MQMRSFNYLVVFISLAFISLQTLAQEEPEIVDVEKNSFFVVNGVNVRNGNFSITYGTGDSLPFDRTYNSRSVYLGMFGLGWGSVFDSRMISMPDGTAIVHENGTGSYTVYMPIGLYRHPEMTRFGIDRILEAAKRRDPSISIDVMRKKLSESDGARFEAVAKYGPIEEFPAGGYLMLDDSTIFSGAKCMDSVMARPSNSDVVSRTGCISGITEVFGLDGYQVSLEVAGVAGEEGGRVFTKIKRDGPFITLLTDEKNRMTKFKYDAKHQLIRQDYPGGNWQAFTYDAHGNMTSITYIDNSKQIMTYDAKDQATSVVKRDGSSAKFEYLNDPDTQAILLTRVTSKTEAGDEKVTIFKMPD